MLQLLEPRTFVVAILVWLLGIAPLFLYPIARWKAQREPHVDNQLGLKVALHYFKLIGFQVLLLGGAVILWTVIRKGGSKGDGFRVGFGYLVPAAIIFGAHVAMLKRTTDETLITVRRLFMGYNLIVTGIIGTVALVVGFQALFAKGSVAEEGRLYLAACLVYVTAWALCGARFAMLSGADLTGAPPQQVTMPPGPPPPAGPSLPSLGGGSYPPINQT